MSSLIFNDVTIVTILYNSIGIKELGIHKCIISSKETHNFICIGFFADFKMFGAPFLRQYH